MSARRYGTPMDPRHNYVKADWLSWVAAMAPSEEGWHKLFDPIFSYANSTSSRQPFTDLYDTVTDKQTFAISFIARPVVGGLFAKMQDARGQITLPDDSRGPVRLNAGQYAPGSSARLKEHTKLVCSFATCDTFLNHIELLELDISHCFGQEGKRGDPGGHRGDPRAF